MGPAEARCSPPSHAPISGPRSPTSGNREQQQPAGSHRRGHLLFRLAQDLALRRRLLLGHRHAAGTECNRRAPRNGATHTRLRRCAVFPQRGRDRRRCGRRRASVDREVACCMVCCGLDPGPSSPIGQLPVTLAAVWWYDSLCQIKRLTRFRAESQSNVGLGGCEPVQPASMFGVKVFIGFFCGAGGHHPPLVHRLSATTKEPVWGQ